MQFPNNSNELSFKIYQAIMNAIATRDVSHLQNIVIPEQELPFQALVFAILCKSKNTNEEQLVEHLSDIEFKKDEIAFYDYLMELFASQEDYELAAVVKRHKEYGIYKIEHPEEFRD